MGWRLAKSLVQLQAQVNQKWPQRSKASDGTIGDAAHSSRASDHNPDGDDVVCAVDITHDPLHGLSSEALAEAIRASRDRRVKYIISNRKICSPDREDWKWRTYSGSNPHNHHVHISVNQRFKDDMAPWKLDGVAAPSGDSAQFKPPPPTLRVGSRGNSVLELQTLLEMDKSQRDSVFGPKTKAAVQQFQRAHSLVDDGIVGPATWAALKKEK